MDQSFESFMELKTIYVDRTDVAAKICFTAKGKLKNGVALILDGPRRSGKTLFLSTIQAIFTKNLDWWEKNCSNLAIFKSIPKALDINLPVINFNFAEEYDKFSFNAEILRTLNKHLPENKRLSEDKIELVLNYNGRTVSHFKSLIKSKEKCVILIDEFDKPMVTLMNSTRLSNQEIEKQMEFLIEAQATFYSAIKGLCQEHIAVVVLAGQAKIAKTSIFSSNIKYSKF